MRPERAACCGKILWTWSGYTAVVLLISNVFDGLGLPGWTGWAAAAILAVGALEKTVA
jgi:hypothetical protein